MILGRREMRGGKLQDLLKDILEQYIEWLEKL